MNPMKERGIAIKIFWGWISAIVVTTALLLRYRASSNLNNWILAYSTISLAFITLFYAIQTKDLVEEERKRRNADFWEKRISDFYHPFLVKLERMPSLFGKNRLNYDELRVLWDGIAELYELKKYFAPQATIDKLDQLFISAGMPLLDESGNDIKGEIKADERAVDEIKESLAEMKALIESEYKTTENQIRKFYGY
jgi:hypothetical protein